MSEGKEYPSLPEQGKNLASFAFEIVKKALKGEALVVSAEIKEQRLQVCKSCDSYDSGQDRCIECGCIMDFKSGFALESCPLNKWKESDEAWMNGKFDELLESLDNDKNS